MTELPGDVISMETGLPTKKVFDIAVIKIPSTILQAGRRTIFLVL